MFDKSLCIFCALLSLVKYYIWLLVHTCRFLFFFVSISSFCILQLASIVDLRVFWQHGSITTGVLNWRDCHVFESNKYLLLLITVH